MEFPTILIEIGPESDLKSKNTTFLTHLNLWNNIHIRWRGFQCNTIPVFCTDEPFGHIFLIHQLEKPRREFKKDRQTDYSVTYLFWKLSQFPSHYSHRAFEPRLLPQKKLKTLGNTETEWQDSHLLGCLANNRKYLLWTRYVQYFGL